MDEVFLKVSPEELSEFPCPLSIETDCDSNCDSSENTETIKEGKIEEVSKVGLATKVKKPKRRRGKKGGRKRNHNTIDIRNPHHLPNTTAVVIHSIIKPLLQDLNSCQKASLDKAHSLYLVTPVSSASLLQGMCVKDSMRESTEPMHSGMEPTHLGVAPMCQCMDPMHLGVALTCQCTELTHHRQQQPLPSCGSLYTNIHRDILPNPPANTY